MEKLYSDLCSYLILGSYLVIQLVCRWLESVLRYMWGGVQTRSVTCMRADGFASSDDKCSRLVGSKPISQQSCNTHTCVECNYQHSSCLQDQYAFRMKYVKNPDWGKDSFQQSEYVWGGIILAYSYSEGETARTINGYYYTKSTSQTSCTHSDSYTLQVYTYTICRQPI